MTDFLIVQRGPEIGKRYDLKNAVTTIGRSDDNDIAFDDPYISRYHAVIKQQGNDLIIIDLGSENSVQIRDTPLEPGEPYTLQNRDVIRIGQNVLGYIDSSKIPARPPMSAANATSVAPALPMGSGVGSSDNAFAPGSFVPSRVNKDFAAPSMLPETGSIEVGSAATGQFGASSVSPNQTENEATVINPDYFAPRASSAPSSTSNEDKPTGRPNLGNIPSVSANPPQTGQSSTPAGYSSPYNTAGQDVRRTGAPPPALPDEDDVTVMGNLPPIQPTNQPSNPNPAKYGSPPQYNQYGQQSNQPQPYGQQPYNQPQQYGQPQYNQPQQYGQNQQAWQGQYVPPEEEEDNDVTQIATYGSGWSKPVQEQPKNVEASKDNNSTVKPQPKPLEPDYDDSDPGDAPTTIIRIDKTVK